MNTTTRLAVALLLACAMNVPLLAQSPPAVPQPPTPVVVTGTAGEQQAVQKERVERAEQRAREAEARAEITRARERAGQSRDHAYYLKGTAALDASRWSQAVEAFAAAAAQRGSRADGALYWKSYAEYKLAQQAAALATLQELRKDFPDSRWLKEASALQAEMSGNTAPASAGSDDELKLLAINGLLQADPDQAVPMLEKILASQQAPPLKKRALFVLSQSHAPRARDVVLGVAMGSSNPDLQLEAVRYLGVIGGAESIKTLGGLYGSSKDTELKRRILETYSISGQKELVAQVATSESNSELRLQAVRLLGAMRATAELDRLYQTEASADVRRAIIEGFMVGGDSDRLIHVARTDKDMALRLRAVEMLGATGRGKNTAVMLELYQAQGQSVEIRRAAVNGIFISGDAKALVELARKEPDPSLRKAIVERLSVMKSKDATDYLMELISK